MASWLTPEVAVLLMFSGVIPSLANVYLLYDERHQPGVLWFLLSMSIGGVWAFLYALFTAIPSPQVTLALANVFWAVVPAAAVTMFLLAYEFVFKKLVSRRVVVVLFSPILLLFLLSWLNPANLIFTPAYHVGSNGFLHFPPLGGPIKIFVTKVYGYLLVFLAAGMFVGEAMRTTGIRRRQTIYLLVVFSMLILSTLVKVADLVPFYFDPTSVVYSLSGLLFAYSINRHGLLKFVPVARERTFQEVNDAIIVVSPDDLIVDANRFGRDLFGQQIVGNHIESTFSDLSLEDGNGAPQPVQIQSDDRQRYFSIRTSPITYGRGLVGKIIVLSDVTELKEREKELDLLKQILSRVFRHNIRNDLNIIIGQTEFLKGHADEQVTDVADRIRNKSNHLLNQAEKARKIEEIFREHTTVERSLRKEVEQVVSSYRPRSDVVIDMNVDDAVVEIHPRFDLAIQELIDNSISHYDAAGTPEIEIHTEIEEDNVILVVEDNGPGIPPNEIEVLHAEEETDLRHSSGIGLWLVRWLAMRSNGKLLAETTDNGTRVRICLPKIAASPNTRNKNIQSGVI